MFSLDFLMSFFIVFIHVFFGPTASQNILKAISKEFIILHFFFEIGVTFNLYVFY